MKNKKVRRIVSCIIALAMTVTLLSGCGSKKDTENDIQDEPENTEEATAEPEASEGLIMSSLTVKVFGANETGAISGAEITLKSGDIEETAKCAEDGTVTFADLQEGGYSLECSADGFYDRETDIRINKEDREYVMPMVPEISGDDAMVLLTWEGDHDLDLCAFNTSVKEYVNIGHPMDSEGNVFLYADHGADQPYEVIYIHNASEEVARSIFITEAKNARNGEPSSMEADGVRIQFFDKNGLSYDCEPSADEDAALWCPCYIYAGTVYDQGDYISDASGEQYAWISFEEKDAYTVADAGTDDGWKQAYLEYIEKVLSEHQDEYSDFYNNDNATYDQVFYFKLIYIDSDDIPELIIGAGSEVLASYHNGELQKYGYDFMNPVTGLYSGVTSYIEGEGKFIWVTGGETGCNEIVCKLNSSGFSQDCAGTVACWDFDYEHPDYYFWDEWDEDGNYAGDDYESYKCNNEADYKKKMSQFYDYSKATDDLGSRGMRFKYSEIVAYLSAPSQSAEASNDAPAAGSDAGWKAAYLEILNKSIVTSAGSKDYPSASLIYVDGDAIPELIIYNFDIGSVAYTYSNGQVITLADFSDYGGYDINIFYMPGQGLIFTDCFVSESSWEYVNQWDGKNSEVLWSGEIAGDWYPGEETVYSYYINNQEVSEDEYNSMRDATGWNFSKSKNCDDNKKSYEEMVALLSD